MNNDKKTNIITLTKCRVTILLIELAGNDSILPFDLIIKSRVRRNESARYDSGDQQVKVTDYR